MRPLAVLLVSLSGCSIGWGTGFGPGMTKLKRDQNADVHYVDSGHTDRFREYESGQTVGGASAGGHFGYVTGKMGDRAKGEGASIEAFANIHVSRERFGGGLTGGFFMDTLFADEGELTYQGWYLGLFGQLKLIRRIFLDAGAGYAFGGPSIKLEGATEATEASANALMGSGGINFVVRRQHNADFALRLGPAIQAGATFTAASGGRVVGVSGDGRGAWVAEEITLTIGAGGDRRTIPYRVTSVLELAVDTWVIRAQCWSVGMLDEEAFARGASGTLQPPAAVPAGGPRRIAVQYEHDLRDAAAWVASFSDSPEAFVFGSAPDEKVQGGAAIKQAFGEKVRRWQVRLAPAGDVRTGMGGSVAWVAGNLDFTATVEGKAATVRYRALVAYANEGKVWRPVQAHFSNGQ